jgi:anti-sigma factor RsiW
MTHDSGRPADACARLTAEDLVAWLDGELAPEEARRVEHHVAGCPACAREADLLRRSGALLAQLPGLAPTPGFADRVVAAARPASPQARVLRGRFGAVAAAAAAILVLAAGGAWLATRSGDAATLSSREEEEIARDLFVLAHLDTLRAADDDLLATLADDLDVLDAAADLALDDDEGG